MCYVYKSRPGKRRTQNTAMEAAKGKVLLFTDDEVEPADDWIEKMSRPLFEGRYDAAAGKILLIQALQRPRFTPMHEAWLAFICNLPDDSPEVIGASIGICRAVFDEIVSFDEKFGLGASGLGEETLLWMQMKEAGLKVLPVRNIHVVHYPEAARLLRTSWSAAAACYGHTGAYILHHWEHERESFPRVQLFWLRQKLFL